MSVREGGGLSVFWYLWEEGGTEGEREWTMGAAWADRGFVCVAEEGRRASVR
jgi:hypothetical protein